VEYLPKADVISSGVDIVEGNNDHLKGNNDADGSHEQMGLNQYIAASYQYEIDSHFVGSSTRGGVSPDAGISKETPIACSVASSSNTLDDYLLPLLKIQAPHIDCDEDGVVIKRKKLYQPPSAETRQFDFHLEELATAWLLSINFAAIEFKRRQDKVRNHVYPPNSMSRTNDSVIVEKWDMEKGGFRAATLKGSQLAADAADALRSIELGDQNRNDIDNDQSFTDDAATDNNTLLVSASSSPRAIDKRSVLHESSKIDVDENAKEEEVPLAGPPTPTPPPATAAAPSSNKARRLFRSATAAALHDSTTAAAIAVNSAVVAPANSSAVSSSTPRTLQRRQSYMERRKVVTVNAKEVATMAVNAFLSAHRTTTEEEEAAVAVAPKKEETRGPATLIAVDPNRITTAIEAAGSGLLSMIGRHLYFLETWYLRGICVEQLRIVLKPWLHAKSRTLADTVKDGMPMPVLVVQRIFLIDLDSRHEIEYRKRKGGRSLISQLESVLGIETTIVH
jgi:hypothetical protein